jgi:hypothetical protein
VDATPEVLSRLIFRKIQKRVRRMFMKERVDYAGRFDA